MLMRILLLLALVAVGTAPAAAKQRHHGQVHATVVAPAPYTGPTLVLHPASNIACNTPYRATRALPCDQPVWVYGHPCEVDRGLGRYLSCD